MVTRKALGGVAVFALALGIYVATAAPSITWRNSGADSAELAAAVQTTGIPHPPGYPTYMLLAKAFSFLLPGEDLAYRLNLMSAILAALACVFVYLSALHLMRTQEGLHPTMKYVVAATAALTLAYSPVLWSQATITEVYALNALIASALFYSVLRWSSRPPSPFDRTGIATVAATGLIFGLGLGNHLTLIFVGLPALFFIWRKRLLEMRSLIALGIAFLAGLSVYLYLPLSAAADPPINWGNPVDREGFLWLVSGGFYRSYAFSLPLQYFPARIAGLAALLVREFNVLGVALGLWGIWRSWVRDKDWTIAALASITLLVVFSLPYNTTDSFLYLVPTFIMFSLWMAEGLGYTLAWLNLRDSRPATRWLRTANVGAALSLILLPAWSLLFNYAALDLSQDNKAYAYGQAAFDAMEPEAIVFAQTDNYMFSLWYFRYVVAPQEQKTVIALPLLQYPWYRETLLRHDPHLSLPAAAISLPDLVAANYERRPIYLTHPFEENAPFELAEKGPLYQVLR